MRRGLIDIIAEILKVAKNGAKKTRILRSCNLSYHLNEEFLVYLMETGLLMKGSSFHTTSKGLRFLRNYQRLDLLMSTVI